MYTLKFPVMTHRKTLISFRKFLDGSFKNLEMKNFGRAYEVKVEDGVTVSMTSISIASGGNPLGVLAPLRCDREIAAEEHETT